MDKREYAKLLQDPRWKSKRLEILERDNNMCTNCRTTFGLQVHHTVYEGDAAPWEYKNDDLITLCANCHKIHHKQEGNSYRRYYAGVIQNATYNKGESSEFKVTNKIRVISSRKIIDIFKDDVTKKDYSFIVNQVGGLLDNVINLYADNLKSKIEVTSEFTGDIVGRIDIKISYDKPAILTLPIKQKVKYKKNQKYNIGKIK